MRIYTFYRGRFTGERWAWTDYRPGSLWIVMGGYVLAVNCGSARESGPYRPAMAKPSAN